MAVARGGDAARDHARRGARADHRLLQRARGRRDHADRRCLPRDPARHSRHRLPRRARPLERHSDHRHRDRLRPDHRPNGAGRGALRAGARVRPGRKAPQRARPLHHVRGDPPERRALRSSSSSPCGSATRSSRSRRSRFSASASSRPHPDWGLQIKENYIIINGGYWWPTLFPALAIGLLVISINLMTDGINRVFAR